MTWPRAYFGFQSRRKDIDSGDCGPPDELERPRSACALEARPYHPVLPPRKTCSGSPTVVTGSAWAEGSLVRRDAELVGHPLNGFCRSAQDLASKRAIYGNRLRAGQTIACCSCSSACFSVGMLFRKLPSTLSRLLLEADSNRGISRCCWPTSVRWIAIAVEFPRTHWSCRNGWEHTLIQHGTRPARQSNLPV